MSRTNVSESPGHWKVDTREESRESRNGWRVGVAPSSSKENFIWSLLILSGYYCPVLTLAYLTTIITKTC